MTLTVLGIGNPLLDYSNEFGPDFFAEYQAADGAAVLYDAEIHKDIYDRMKNMSTTNYLPGGATQNTMRAVASLAQQPGFVGYMGCVGSDDDAVKMKKINDDAKLSTWYQNHPTEKTGVCAVVVNKTSRDRSMITRLGAACCFDIKHLEANWDKVEQASVIYSAGFFVSSCPEGMLKVAKHCAANNKFWAVCLCAEFIVQFHKDQVTEWIRHANLVVGNETEWRCYSKEFNLPENSSDQEILKSVVSSPGWQCKDGRPRIAIMTRGSEDTLVVFKSESEILTEEYPVIPVAEELIKDTNGCGDTFLGGFLYAWALKLPIQKCVEVGHVCASEVLATLNLIIIRPVPNINHYWKEHNHLHQQA